MSQQLSDKIYQASNKGLDIITSVHPDALNIGSNSKNPFALKTIQLSMAVVPLN